MSSPQRRRDGVDSGPNLGCDSADQFGVARHLDQGLDDLGVLRRGTGLELAVDQASRGLVEPAPQQREFVIDSRPRHGAIRCTQHLRKEGEDRADRRSFACPDAGRTGRRGRTLRRERRGAFPRRRRRRAGQPVARSGRLEEGDKRMNGRLGVAAVRAHHHALVLLDGQQHELHGTLRVGSLIAPPNLDFGREGLGKLNELCRRPSVQPVLHSHQSGALDHAARFP